ncbi:MAG: spermidine synthase [Dermatophilaceae bacterium]
MSDQNIAWTFALDRLLRGATSSPHDPTDSPPVHPVPAFDATTGHDEGVAEIAFERDGSLVTVIVDGQPQSAVDLGDPERLDFEYVQHLAMCLDALSSPGVIRATHVGGAGLTLARWVAHTRPSSPQVVLEPDAALTDLVRAELPLPRGHRIRVRPVRGEAGIHDLRDGSADVVVVDAYAGGRVPAELTAVEWLEQLRRVLVPGGLVLANLADEPGLRYVARVAAGARTVLGYVAVVGLYEVLKNKRFGNAVLVASTGPLDLYRLRRAAASAPLPTGVLSGPDLARRHPGIRPFSAADDDLAPSPEPPPRDLWRRR